MIKWIRERIRRNTRRSMWQMAKSIDMSPRTMRRLVHKDLKMSSFTLQKRQTLSAAVKQKRLERSKVLLKEFMSGTAGAIVWSDEKIFTIKFTHNRRNDSIWIPWIFRCGPSSKPRPWKNSLQCGRFKTISTASIARNSTRTAACLRGGCSPKIAGGNQKQWEPFRINLFCLLCIDFHVIVHICKLLDIFFVTL